MSKAPNLSGSVKTLIVQEAINDRKIPRRVLATKLKDIIERMGEPVPTDETLERLISRARNHAPDPLDQPWSLGASANPANGINPEANKTLLKVWRLSLAIDSIFTVREAKWVSQIWGAHEFCGKNQTQKTMALFFHARQYALREQVCEILRKTLDTSDYDSLFIEDDAERTVAKALGRLSLGRYQETWGQAISLGLIERFNIPMPFSTTSAAEEVQRRLNREFDEKVVLPAEIFETLSEEQDFIYAHCLSYLSRGNKWRSLPCEKRKDVMLQLISRVKEYKEYIAKEMDINPLVVIGMKPRDVLGVKLLKMVGYDVPKMVNSENEDSPGKIRP